MNKQCNIKKQPVRGVLIIEMLWKLLSFFYMPEKFCSKSLKNTCKGVYLSEVADPMDAKVAKNKLLHGYFSKTDQRFQNT